MPVVKTIDTSYGRVQFGFAFINGEIKTKLLSIVLKDVRFENTVEGLMLVPVKGDQLGLPFFVHAHWQEFSAATQEAINKIDWHIVEVLLWDNALIEYEQEIEVIDRDVQAAAAIKRYQLHVQGDIDRLLAEKNIRGVLELVDEFFQTILTKRRK